MYGYDSGASTPRLAFGLNQGIKLQTFTFNPNGGKDGAVQDVLDIVFVNSSGQEINYRQFPVTKAYDNGNEVTDPNHKAMKKAFKNFNTKITQIMECFVSAEEIKNALEGVKSFKDYCQRLANILPSNFQDIELDIFAQYQWQPKSEGDIKYVELPKNALMGKIFVPAQEGDFKAIEIDEETHVVTYEGEEFAGTEEGGIVTAEINGKQVHVSKNIGIAYVNLSGEESVLHPIQRNHWFCASNWALKANDDVADAATEGW